MLAPFNSLEKASEAVSAIFSAGITPSALELMEIDAITLATKMLDSNAIPLTPDLAAHLIIEVDGNNLDVLMNEMEAISEVLANYEVGELYFADDAQQKNELWKIRRKANEASVAAGYTIEEDTVVPRAELPKLIKGVKILGVAHGFKVVCYGHAGDGNLHIRINHPTIKKSFESEEMQSILKELFKLVHSLGGTISGEHGIGLIQKSFMPVVFNPITMELMRGIKKTFDPNYILNPGKIFDQHK
jgi:glycolate oxidase